MVMMMDGTKTHFKKPKDEVKSDAKEFLIMFIGTILLALPLVIGYNMHYTNHEVCNITEPGVAISMYEGTNITRGPYPMKNLPDELPGFEVEAWRAEIRWPRLSIGDDLSRQEVFITCWKRDRGEVS